MINYIAIVLYSCQSILMLFVSFGSSNGLLKQVN